MHIAELVLMGALVVAAGYARADEPSGAGESHSPANADVDASADPPASTRIVPSSAEQARDRAFAAQPVDPAWAPGVESAIEDALESSPMAFTEKKVECRTSMCRAVLLHPFVERPPDFNDMLFETQLDLRRIVERNSRLQSILMSSDVAPYLDESMTTTVFLTGAVE